MRSSLCLAFAIALVLTGCASVSGITPRTPAQTVYALEGVYAEALVVEGAYKKIPNANPEFVARLRTYDDLAYAALLTAEDAVRKDRSATAAILDADKAISAFLTLALSTGAK